MMSLTVWCLVTLLIIVGVSVALRLSESVWTGGLLASRRSRGLALLGSVVLLAVLAGLLKVHAVAWADSEVVRSLSHSRSDATDPIMAILTTVGDSIPSFTIAGSLAVVVYRQGAHPYACWVLPVIVLVELYAQVVMSKVFHDLTIADVAVTLTSGHHGSLPSGSVARLFLIFVITARLWHSTSPRQSRIIMGTGGILLVVQSVSRLYLGRHLVLDLAGGLLLGLALFLVVSLVIADRPASADHDRDARGCGGATV